MHTHLIVLFLFIIFVFVYFCRFWTNVNEWCAVKRYSFITIAWLYTRLIACCLFAHVSNLLHFLTQSPHGSDFAPYEDRSMQARTMNIIDFYLRVDRSPARRFRKYRAAIQSLSSVVSGLTEIILGLVDCSGDEKRCRYIDIYIQESQEIVVQYPSKIPMGPGTRRGPSQRQIIDLILRSNNDILVTIVFAVRAPHNIDQNGWVVIKRIKETIMFILQTKHCYLIVLRILEIVELYCFCMCTWKWFKCTFV